MFGSLATGMSLTLSLLWALAAVATLRCFVEWLVETPVEAFSTVGFFRSYSLADIIGFLWDSVRKQEPVPTGDCEAEIVGMFWVSWTEPLAESTVEANSCPQCGHLSDMYLILR